MPKTKPSADVQIARYKTAFLGFCVVLLVITMRVAYLQLWLGEHFAQQARQNTLRTQEVPSLRGNVRDCYGVLLATNTPVYNLSWEGQGKRFLDNEQVASIEKLLELLDEGENCEAILQRVRQAQRYGRRVKIRDDVPFDLLCTVREQCGDCHNIVLDTSFKRIYPYHSLASHVIGYLSGGGSAHFMGRSGLEQLFEDELVGQDGYEVHVMNATGKKLAREHYQKATSGSDIILTLDRNIQACLEEAFDERFCGAALVMDPHSGAIRAMHSFPNFDPNAFLRRISHDEWKEKFTKGSPFLNRVTQALYPPASLFKIITYAAGIEEGLVDLDGVFECVGHMMFSSRRYNCQRRWGHGELTCKQAIAASCNIPCYKIALNLSIDTLADYAYRFGLGYKTGFLLPEQGGLVPTSNWKRAKKKERWWTGETLSASIGQSFLQVTPLQIARMMSGIVTGNLVRPRILQNTPPELSPIKIEPSTLLFFQQSLEDAPRYGTCRVLRPLLGDFHIGGKTGTAQMTSLKKAMASGHHLEHGWFTGYFTYKDQRPLVIVVVLEHTRRSLPALLVAKKFLTKYAELSEASSKASITIASLSQTW